ncbi:hypothetical protein CEXT_456201 [Caerostris extrusa]|uniref:Uncharacterized protein n=1 Tax=Caerostris extrusa TaxID=172846 RepID=A0AAV4RQA0_CAEEX|nr:hypothetical protein CEXT_456201 [Caerostris extrusa]
MNHPSQPPISLQSAKGIAAPANRNRKKQQSFAPSPPFDNYPTMNGWGMRLLRRLMREAALQEDMLPNAVQCLLVYGFDLLRKGLCVRRWDYGREFLLDVDDEESLLRLIGWTHYTDAEALDHQSRDLATPTNTSNELNHPSQSILSRYKVQKDHYTHKPQSQETTVLPTIAPFLIITHNEWLGNQITSQIDEIGRSAFAAKGDAAPQDKNTTDTLNNCQLHVLCVFSNRITNYPPQNERACVNSRH